MSPKLNPNDPDYQLEEFWLSFKLSIINFFTIIKKDCSIVEKWSKYLNSLKEQKKYLEIEECICYYICEYAFYLIKFSDSDYYDDILITNMHRWNNLSKKFNLDYNNNFLDSKLLNENNQYL